MPTSCATDDLDDARLLELLAQETQAALGRVY